MTTRRKETMKNTIGLVTGSICLVSAVLILFASPAAAKKGKEDRPLFTPTVTAEQAVSIVKDVLPKLAAGKYWVKTGPKGDKKVNVALILEGKIVSKVELNPATGEIMPKGQRIFAEQVSANPEQAVDRVRQAIPNLEVATARLGKDGEWKVELTLKKGVIADINIHSGDGSILTDWGASRESTLSSGM
jgi:hypothetical protein